MAHSPVLRPVSLKETAEEVESELRSAKILKTEDAGEKQKMTSNTLKKKPLYLTVLPNTVIKFTRASTRKRARLTISSRTPEVVPDTSPEERCGLACLVIPYCQRFNSIPWFMTFYSVLLVSQGIVFGIIDVSNNDFEKDHTVTTIEHLALTLTYDVSSCLLALIIAYYGGSGNRVKWIALSSFLVGFGSLLLAFPYITVKHFESKVEAEDICSTKPFDSFLRSKSSFKANYITFFTLGQIVQGIAAMPLYILGITFLNDSVPKHLSGVYLGISDAASILGYALGFAIGSPRLEVSQNSSQASNAIDIMQKKNWWHDFVIATSLAWSTLIPLLCFPPVIAGTAKIRARKQKEFHLVERDLKDWKFGASIKDLFGGIWIVLKNPVCMCQILSKASESLMIIGASEILPIYLETQFILTPATATALTGFILIPAGALGQLLGGIIAYYLEMSCKALMRFIVVSSAVSIILLGMVMFVHCNPVRFAGISENYNGTGQLGNLTAPCNDHCGCSTSLYLSVCGRDSTEYFSPCFAGCTTSKIINNKKMYYSCSCIKEGLMTADADGDVIDAVLGKCNMYCHTLPLFFAFTFSSLIFSGFSGVPLNLIILRIVPNKLHSVALGLTYTFMRLFGTIPGPALFRGAGELCCTFRDRSKYGHEGRCWVYNKAKMAIIMIGICFLCKICTICFTLIGFYQYSYFVKEKKDILHDISAQNIKAKKKRTKL